MPEEPFLRSLSCGERPQIRLQHRRHCSVRFSASFRLPHPDKAPPSSRSRTIRVAILDAPSPSAARRGRRPLPIRLSSRAPSPCPPTCVPRQSGADPFRASSFRLSESPRPDFAKPNVAASTNTSAEGFWPLRGWCDGCPPSTPHPIEQPVLHTAIVPSCASGDALATFRIGIGGSTLPMKTAEHSRRLIPPASTFGQLALAGPDPPSHWLRLAAVREHFRLCATIPCRLSWGEPFQDKCRRKP
jgi:hypothetical protein